jgi:hypothetical protein
MILIACADQTRTAFIGITEKTTPNSIANGSMPPPLLAEPHRITQMQRCRGYLQCWIVQ